MTTESDLLRVAKDLQAISETDWDFWEESWRKRLDRAAADAARARKRGAEIESAHRELRVLDLIFQLARAARAYKP